MAILKLGGIVTKISGKLGGNILGTSVNGSYIKSNSFSQQHPSTAQSKQRTKLYPVTQLWRSLTPGQQALWSAEVSNYPYVNKVGDAVEYTGYQLFNKLNQNLALVGLPTLSVPSTFQTNNTYEVTSVNYAGSNMSVGLTGTTQDGRIAIYASKPFDYTVQPKYSYLRFIGWVFSNANNVNFNTGSAYTDIYPFPQVGQTTFFACKTVNDPSGNSSLFSDIFTSVRP